MGKILKPKAHPKIVSTSLRLPAEFLARLDARAKQLGHTRTELIIICCEYVLREDEEAPLDDRGAPGTRK